MDRQVKKTVIIVFSAVMFFLITAGGLYYYLSSTKKEVTVLSEYNKYSAVVYGNADVSKVLARAGISLRPGDILYASLSDPVADGDVIYINYEETEETLWSASSAADTANYVAPNSSQRRSARITITRKLKWKRRAIAPVPSAAALTTGPPPQAERHRPPTIRSLLLRIILSAQPSISPILLPLKRRDIRR
jgi:hypothetical protein